MGWRADSSLGAYIYDTEPMTPGELAQRDEELRWLVDHERRNWKLINGRITGRDKSFPQGPLAMAEGTYGALGAYPPAASIAGPAMSTTEAGIIAAANIAIYTPIPANSQLAPQAWRYFIGGVYTAGATPGTIAFTPRLGNANTSPSLGASAAITQTALTNAFWAIYGDITVRSIGGPGLNSKAQGMAWAKVNTAVGGAFNTALWGTGTTDASFDSTIALGTNGGGLWLGGTDAGATNHATYTMQQIHWMDWN
jgi:hypothetical protein